MGTKTTDITGSGWASGILTHHALILLTPYTTVFYTIYCEAMVSLR